MRYNYFSFRVLVILCKGFWSPHTDISGSVTAASFVFWDSVGFSSSQICGVFFQFLTYNISHQQMSAYLTVKNMVIYSSLCHLMIKMIDLVLNVHENTCLQTNCLFSWFHCKQRQWDNLSHAKQKRLTHIAPVTAMLRVSIILRMWVTEPVWIGEYNSVVSELLVF